MGDHKNGAIVAPSPDRSEKGVTGDSAKKGRYQAASSNSMG
jgi:hypothetical protein